MNAALKSIGGLMVLFGTSWLCLAQNDSRPRSDDTQTNTGSSLDRIRQSIRKKSTEQTANPAGPMVWAGAGALPPGGSAEGGMGSSFPGGMGAGVGGGTGSGYGMPGADGGMGYGGSEMGMGYGVPTTMTSEKQRLLSMIQVLRQGLASKSQNREEAERLLRRALQEYFEADMEERVREFDKIKARIAEMESKLEKRLERQQELIELQLKQMLHKADGLDFHVPSVSETSGYGASGFGGEGSGGAGYGDVGGFGGGAGAFGGMPGGTGSMGGFDPNNTRAVNKIGYDVMFGLTQLHRLNSTMLSESDPLKAYFQFNNPILYENSNPEKLKVILRALHGFHERFHHFPAAANRHSKNQPAHSWRVAILPLIGQGDLYREYDFDEPWDSENNRGLIDRMPDVFKTEVSGTGTTHFVLSSGDGAFVSPGSAVSLSDVMDGTSNTIAVIQLREAAIWTQPVEVTANALSTMQLGKDRLIGLADGTIRNLPFNLSDGDFRAMLTRAGGETFSLPQ